MTKCNVNSCPCPKTKCERHGKCCECIKHHRDIKTLVYCMRQIANSKKP
ncbi:hypothetical protein [Alkaliphilus peptidifermentans]|uniref:Uncharacterized protein n=1 Tax=Alkaliphilus peptidifermentans DSM 18978 TaxID=1120976 RepID=A0A1G5JVV1_9FIRM|nr:hypothetical protein [Alkaliphilus peptidifermentans]SCY92513.1 hypothetical protein SAMN03080606_03068 [Alkaliphilus peptidifermentans DSM 18978]